jgi:hypothetical protein
VAFFKAHQRTTPGIVESLKDIRFCLECIDCVDDDLLCCICV